MHATPERQAGATHHFSELVTPQIQALQLHELMHASVDTHTHKVLLALLTMDSAWHTNISK